MKLYMLSQFCLLSLVCFAHTSNKHMICKDVDDVFGEVTNGEEHPRYVGSPEKKGIKGEKGAPGTIGQPGRIDYDKVQEIIRLKVEEETRLLQVKVDKMETQIQNLTLQISETRALRVTEQNTVPQTTTQPTTVVRCVGGVVHEGICYWAEVRSYRSTNYAEAKKICSNKRSRLADIYGKVHFDLIMSYIRGQLSGLPSLWMWTGMKKIPGNNIAQLSDGSPAPYTRQRNFRLEWEIADSSHTHVYLAVRSSTNDSDQGMGANSPVKNLQGALCQTQ